jgi:hypothetical protein
MAKALEELKVIQFINILVLALALLKLMVVIVLK